LQYAASAHLGKQDLHLLKQFEKNELVMNYVTLLTPLAHERNSFFKCKQKDIINETRRTEKLHTDEIQVDILQYAANEI